MTNEQFLKTIQNMQNQNNTNAKAVANTSFQQSMYAQKDSQAFNSAEAEKNRQFQLGMSNTSHQREVEDLQRAGLNPILSVNNGAPVTSGATASSGQASAQKAEVDMQTAGLYANWIMNKQNNAMQLKINKLNNANALKMSKIAAAAQMASASMSAGAQIYASNISRANTLTNAETQKYGFEQALAGTKYSANKKAWSDFNDWRWRSHGGNNPIDKMVVGFGEVLQRNNKKKGSAKGF